MSIKPKYLACLSIALVLPLFTIGGTASAADEVFAPTTAIVLPAGSQPLASFDISFVDPVLGIYILGDRSNKSVDVVDTDTNTVLTQLHATPPFAGATGNNDTSGPDGVLVIRHREVWAGDGNSTVKVINLFSGATTHVISTAGVNRADEMCWDPRDRLVMVANNADSPPFASIISTDTYTVLKKIPFDGTNGAPNSNNGIEQCQWSPRTGKFYITVPGIAGHPAGEGGVAVIDPVTKTVVATFIIPLAACSTPQGSAIGPDHQLGIGCNGANATQSSVILDERNGHVIAAIPNESGPDEIWFNPGDGHYFLARSSAVGSQQLLGVIDAENPSGPRADQSVFTAFKNVPGRNAHSVAADPVFNQVYVPIPAGNSNVCSRAGAGPTSDASGCIAVYTTPHDDPRPRMMVDRDHDRDHGRH
jgi:hypothetical protein